MKRAFRTMLLALFALALIEPISAQLSVTVSFGPPACRSTTSRFVRETGIFGLRVTGPTIRTTATTGFLGLGWKRPNPDTSGHPDGGDGGAEVFSSMKAIGRTEVGFYGGINTASAILAMDSMAVGGTAAISSTTARL